ncbi:Cbb3-type cytochrome oxidase component FixQ [Pirellulimonas nuda]|uniref:Cbb3-type cytochrome oxidase component FixQ n=1 Tax=Pirellulimonas nuda TaxID=2528009 RepID=A0A518DHS0_9BACT|nr:cbb3-type cytochrome c oxidase subunit 3 [Pirellulimonas nuda]QDU91025.1 Cbb3-type cytochrome oxidase component FixQ [Pirellulimonas nuda]
MNHTILAQLNLAPFAVTGLVVFVTVFLGVVAWTLTRRKKQVDRWARLPLSDEDEPSEPHTTSKGLPTNTRE